MQIELASALTLTGCVPTNEKPEEVLPNIIGVVVEGDSISIIATDDIIKLHSSPENYNLFLNFLWAISPSK